VLPDNTGVMDTSEATTSLRLVRALPAAGLLFADGLR
jgi:hypothetical protein